MKLNETAQQVIMYGIIDEVKKQTSAHIFLDAFDYLREKGYSNLSLNKYEKEVLEEWDYEKNTKIPQYDPEGYDEVTREAYENEGRYGIMYSENYEWDNIECTKRAYGQYGDTMWERSVAFHTPLLDLEEAIRCVKEIPRYNAFNPEKVAEQLGKLPEETKIAVGREASPVLYIWTDRKERVVELFKELKDIKENSEDWTAGPDEFREIENGKYDIFKVPENADPDKVLIRTWWD